MIGGHCIEFDPIAFILLPSDLQRMEKIKTRLQSVIRYVGEENFHRNLNFASDKSAIFDIRQQVEFYTLPLYFPQV